MAGRVVVVTDSTAYLPAGAADDLGVVVVPLQVAMGGRSYAEGVDIDGAMVSRALQAGLTVTTSRPSSQAFVEAYRTLAAQGATSIVSVHLSGDMSGTVDAARSAAREVGADGMDVHVVDSRSMGMGIGFGVLAAARLASSGPSSGPSSGASAQDVAQLAARRSLNATIYFYVDTLEYLRRGGRIGAAQAWLGSALTIKPLLHMVDGRLEPLDRVRTTERAIARLVEVAAGDAKAGDVEVAVHHLDAEERAADVAQRLRDQVPDLGEVLVSEVGGVVGAHVGPGTVGVVVSPIE